MNLPIAISPFKTFVSRKLEANSFKVSRNEVEYYDSVLLNIRDNYRNDVLDMIKEDGIKWNVNILNIAYTLIYKIEKIIDLWKICKDDHHECRILRDVMQ